MMILNVSVLLRSEYGSLQLYPSADRFRSNAQQTQLKKERETTTKVPHEYVFGSSTCMLSSAENMFSLD